MLHSRESAEGVLPYSYGTLYPLIHCCSARVFRCLLADEGPLRDGCKPCLVPYTPHARVCVPRLVVTCIAGPVPASCVNLLLSGTPRGVLFVLVFSHPTSRARLKNLARAHHVWYLHHPSFSARARLRNTHSV